MHAIADTNRLVADGVISPAQAREIESRGRAAMVALAVNTVLVAGIVSATAGLIFLLASLVAVALIGLVTLVAGVFILARGAEMVRIFGNAATLIGAGLLLGGGAAELLTSHEAVAGPAMAVGGAVIVAGSAYVFLRAGMVAQFVPGAVLLMGVALHIGGLGLLIETHAVAGLPVAGFFLYGACLLAVAGWLIDVRFVTALAIVPFAQALDTGTFYFHAAYVFVSPEPTLSILQMALLIGLCLGLGSRAPDRLARHTGTLAVLALIVANLCALVGSLWGDYVGDTIWGPSAGGGRPDGVSWDDYSAAVDAFQAQAIHVPAGAYSILWAAVLAGLVLWSAHRGMRGLFNTSLSFGAIHAYTQLFESFGDEPLAYVIGGLAAIPLGWAMWRLNAGFSPPSPDGDGGA